MMRRVARSLVVLGVAAIAANPRPASAQARYILVATIMADFGRMSDFIAYERQIQEARRRTNDPRAVSIYQVQAGGPPNRFDAVIGFDDLSEMDSWPSVPELLVSAYGEREGARIYAEGSATIASVAYVVHVLHPEWSSGANVALSGTQLTQLVTTRVRPELAEDYEAYLTALKPAEDERGIRRSRRSVTMGELFTYTAISQASSWSLLRSGAPPPAVIVDEYGEDLGGSLLARADAAVVDRTIQVFRLREDLSYSGR